jgi:predicted CoA-substrate-specific enzyme activase
MLVAGIDIGSGTTKCVLVDEGGAVRGRGQVKTKADFEKVAREVVAAALDAAGSSGEAVAYTATTGLGRYAVPFRDIQITDLTCGARGAATACPEARFVLDIGAQCSRAIHLRDGGKVKEFHMNEKCAAGSGGFLERAAKYLEVSVADIGPLSLGAALTLAWFIPLGIVPPLSVSGDALVLIYLLTLCGVSTLMAGLAAGSTYSLLGVSREMMSMLTLEPLLAVAVIV